MQFQHHHPRPHCAHSPCNSLKPQQREGQRGGRPRPGCWTPGAPCSSGPQFLGLPCWDGPSREKGSGPGPGQATGTPPTWPVRPTPFQSRLSGPPFPHHTKRLKSLATRTPRSPPTPRPRAMQPALHTSAPPQPRPALGPLPARAQTGSEESGGSSPSTSPLQPSGDRRGAGSGGHQLRNIPMKINVFTGSAETARTSPSNTPPARGLSSSLLAPKLPCGGRRERL